MTSALHQLERDARAALAERYGRALSDEEWERAKIALVQFAEVLRDWSTPAAERAA